MSLRLTLKHEKTETEDEDEDEDEDEGCRLTPTTYSLLPTTFFSRQVPP
jgi:hypothetical protein